MRRLYAGAIGLMLGGAGAHAITDNTSVTFTIEVGTIVEFITSDTTNATNTTQITNWDVDDGFWTRRPRPSSSDS